MFSPVSCASCSLMCLVGFGVALNAAFSVSSCFAFIVVRGPLLFVQPCCGTDDALPGCPLLLVSSLVPLLASSSLQHSDVSDLSSEQLLLSASLLSLDEDVRDSLVSALDGTTAVSAGIGCLSVTLLNTTGCLSMLSACCSVLTLTFESMSRRFEPQKILPDSWSPISWRGATLDWGWDMTSVVLYISSRDARRVFSAAITSFSNLSNTPSKSSQSSGSVSVTATKITAEYFNNFNCFSWLGGKIKKTIETITCYIFYDQKVAQHYI